MRIYFIEQSQVLQWAKPRLVIEEMEMTTAVRGKEKAKACGDQVAKGEGKEKAREKEKRVEAISLVGCTQRARKVPPRA